jgi:hypothetical protein
MKRFSQSLFTLFGFLLLTTSAAAGTPSKADLAKKHFSQGEAFYQQGEFRKALAEYKKAHAHKAHPALIFNMAQCHRQLGEYTKALFFYRLFLSESPQAANKEEVLRRIREMEEKAAQKAVLEKRKGKVSVITVPGGAHVHVDRFIGAPLAKTPAVLKFTAGQHLVVVRKKGYKTVHRSVTVRPGGFHQIKITLERDPTARMWLKRSRPFYKRWWFWSGVALTAALAVTGTVTGVLTLRKVDAWEKNHNNNDLKLGKRLRTVTDVVLFTALGAAVAVTVGALVVGRGRKNEQPTAVITPGCGPNGCGVWVSGRF